MTSSSSFIRSFYNGSILFAGANFIHLTNRNCDMLFVLGAVMMTVGLLILLFAQVPGSILKKGAVDWSPVGFVEAIYHQCPGSSSFYRVKAIIAP